MMKNESRIKRRSEIKRTLERGTRKEKETRNAMEERRKKGKEERKLRGALNEDLFFFLSFISSIKEKKEKSDNGQGTNIYTSIYSVKRHLVFTSNNFTQMVCLLSPKQLYIDIVIRTNATSELGVSSFFHRPSLRLS